ncbi:hypothetical protein [Micromonospora olivasterospora]|uniref:Uncharacterized protein n=3 Tax=Micromonospora olivasterospora TaxID=1880 RepID=A0A562IJD2_MICOL|nr:hypothetical protein [Micromonospora olivasterospora]TWH70992.1 hypothetical protein JD77_06017 [Micromonospora olivasterospora]
MSTDFGQPRIDDQAGDGGNLGDWATWQEDPALDLFDPLHPVAWGGPPTAVGTGLYPGPQPMDPTWPQAPPDPTPWSQPSGDQPSQFPGTQSIPPGPGMQEPAPQSPMPGPAPAPPADTGLPWLPWPLDAPDAPTVSSWQAGWTEPGWPEPGWPVSGSGVTAHGAGMSTDFGQPRDQAGDGGDLGDWATWQGPDMDWQPSLAPSPAVTRTDAGTVHAGDTPHHPADEPPTTPASLHPDQPQPTAGSRWVRNRNDARTLFDQHADHIATTTQQRVDQLLRLWNALINHMDADGTITVTEPALAEATSTSRQTVHNRIVALRDRGLLQLVQEARPGVAARYGVSDPGQPRQAPLPDLPAGSQWVRNRNDAQTLFNQHADHIATTPQQQNRLRQLWNALINHMGADGTITVTESALAAATSTSQQTVHNRIVALRDRGLLQLVREAHGGVAARYGVSDPGQPRQAPLPDLPEGRQWVRNRNDAQTLFDQHADHIATTTQQREQLPQLWNALINHMGADGIITASESDLAAATSTSQTTVHSRIGVLRDSGLLQLVQEAHSRGAARYGVTDPGQPRQAPVPGPAPEPDRPQGSEDLSRLNHGDTSPMPGPAPAPPADTGLPGLSGPPGPLDAPDALTASAWPAGRPRRPGRWRGGVGGAGFRH